MVGRQVLPLGAFLLSCCSVGSFVVRSSYHRPVTVLGASSGNDEASAVRTVAVVGEPGSGQTTYTNLVAERYGLQKASMSDEGNMEALRDKLAGKLGMMSFQKAWCDVMVDRVSGLVGGEKVLVVDGWPRNMIDLQGLVDKGVKLDRLVYLDTGEDDEGTSELAEVCRRLGADKVIKVENDDRPIEVVFQDITAQLDPLLGKGAKGSKAATKKQEAAAPPAKESGSEAPAKQPAKAKAAKQGGAEDLMFGGLVVRGPAAESLRSRGIMRATTIQEAAMVKIMRGDNVLIHAETGSGKTLAYALPLLQILGDAKTPRQALVVTPTRELAVQVAGEIARLQEGGEVRDGAGVALLLEPGQGLHQVEAPVVVGTAKVMWAELQAANTTKATLLQAVDNLRVIVMDEVDRSIAPLGAYATLKEKRQKARHPKPSSRLLAEIYLRLGMKPQFIGASATIGRPLKRELAGSMGVDPKLEGPITVRADEPPPSPSDNGKPPSRAVTIPPAIRHFYLAVPDDDLELKVRATRDYLNDKRPKRPLVFLPNALSVRDVTSRLKRAMEPHGWDVRALHDVLGFGQGGDHKAMDWKDAVARHREVALPSVGSASTQLLVTSAESARGLDLAGVDCVMVYGRVDGPDEYQHVAGRTGRQGARGVVVSVLSYVDVKKLTAFESMLGIHFRQAVMGKGPMR